MPLLSPLSCCPAPAHLAGSHAVPGAAVQRSPTFLPGKKNSPSSAGLEFLEGDGEFVTRKHPSRMQEEYHINVDNFIFDIFIFCGDRLCTGNPLSYYIIDVHVSSRKNCIHIWCSNVVSLSGTYESKFSQRLSILMELDPSLCLPCIVHIKKMC